MVTNDLKRFIRSGGFAWPGGFHWEGDPLICAHSGRAIESAYGEVE
jgi:hypothetical protein